MAREELYVYFFRFYVSLLVADADWLVRQCDGQQSESTPSGDRQRQLVVEGARC